MTPVRTHTKICGLRDPDTARVALDAGVDLVGVVFAESRRRVDVATALAIRKVLGPRAEILDSSAEAIDRALDDHRPLLVGVFAKQTSDEINRIVAQVDLDLVQLSGGEHPSITARLQRPVIRVIHVDDSATVAATLADAERQPESVTMLDTKSEIGGGSGQPFDWSIALGVARMRPIMLAGGLSSHNVQDAIAQVRPWGVDVSSGVETDGDKDHDKICAFVAAARAAQEAPTP